MATAAATKMRYRFLGNTGLLVSQISLGAWMHMNDGYDEAEWYRIMKSAFEHGVNLFDNAEFYELGHSEEIVGAALQKGISEGVWAREDLVLTTKIYVGTKEGPNAQGLSRKHLIEGTKASLKRLQTDYVDLLYCHRYEPYTPMEEIVRTMNWLIDQGLAHYWGTSQWLAADIIEACEVADRLGLIRPVVEQPKYNIFERQRVEGDFEILFKKYKLGTTTYSPLASGVLSGKYTNGVMPEHSRLTMDFFKQLHPDYPERIEKAFRIKQIADDLGCSLGEFSIAWAAANPNVSTVLLGTRTLKQLEENLKAIAFIDKITPEIRARVDAAIGFVPEPAKQERLALIRSKYL